jgi:hypothetical protein
VLNLGLVIGPDFPAITGNLARNIRENRLGVLSAVLTRNRSLSPPGALLREARLYQWLEF